MRVTTLYTDASGTYRIRADVRENNRSVHILDIRDNEYESEADWDDFSDEEKADVQAAILDEYDRLDNDNGEEYDDDVDDDSESDSDY